MTSLRAGMYAMVASLWALLIIPVSINAAVALITWQLTVTSKRVFWDGTFTQGAPNVVATQDIVRLSVARSDTDGGPVTRITLHLRAGSERELPTMLTPPPNDAAFVQAIQRALPKSFTRHLS